MIVTLTPNPSVDRTVFIDDIVLGSVNRSRRSWSEPSGKGVNVALALHTHGEPVRAVVTAGGSVGAQLRQMLDTAGLDTVFVPVTGEIRANVSLTRPDGTVTKINEAGPVLTADEVDRLVQAVTAATAGASLLVCGGSLPAGAPTDLYARLTELAARQNVPVVIDSSGAPLAASIAALPQLIKPNTHELAELTGRALHTLGDVVDAADEVRSRGAGAVLASLGADGAVLVDATGALYGRAPVDRVVSTVGAGDAMLAGYLAGRADRRTALATALEWGAAAVQHEGTLFSTATAPHVQATLEDHFDRSRPLRDDEPAPTAAPGLRAGA
ncbi:1-phosphofructokinase [Rhodococcus opacus]|uniref:1-phosphofructokinase n=1 Tax=Rhodococcus opacus TaxID=37919 RepID=UPI001C4801CF|nr:1-phosphofructokinase [Rhodococcus opacus]MBV6760208.1 1-phosphofructokinase [Rhodococcus opacus]